MDGNVGGNQVKVAMEDIEKTMFIIPLGNLQLYNAAFRLKKHWGYLSKDNYHFTTWPDVYESRNICVCCDHKISAGKDMFRLFENSSQHLENTTYA